MPGDLPLRVGVDTAPPPPMCFGLPGTNAFTGFEVDLLDSLAARLARDLAFEASLWTELLARLNAGDLDLVCTAATITPEREERLLFSRPYLRTALALVCRRDCPIATLEGVSGLVGARANTPAEAYALARTTRLSTFHFNTDAYRALEDGTLDAVVDDLPIGGWFAAQSRALLVGAQVPGTEAEYGLVFARSQTALKRAFDSALVDLVQTGIYGRLYEQWMAPVVGDACDIRGAPAGAKR